MLLCVMLCMVLLAACGKQAAEVVPADTQPTTELTQPSTVPVGDLEDDELPPVILPVETEPVTEPDVEPTPTEPPKATEPSEPVKETQPQVSKPTEPTEPVTTAPTEPTPTEPAEPETQPTEPTEIPRLDENELPPVPVF